MIPVPTPPDPGFPLAPLLRATILLAVSAAVVAAALRIARPESPLWHRLAWGLVLAQGLAFLIPAFPVVLRVAPPDDPPAPPIAAVSAIPPRSEPAPDPEPEPGEAADEPRIDVSSAIVRVSHDPNSETRLPDRKIEAGEPPTPSNRATKPRSTTETESPQPAEFAFAIAEADADAGDAPTAPESPRLAAAAPPAPGPTPDVDRDPRSESRARSAFPFPAGVVLAVWLGGAAILAALHVLGYALFLARLRAARPAPPEWAAELDAALRREGVRRPVPLLVHPRLGPLICRVPGGHRVVVPEALWAELPPRQRVAVLRHEAAHHRAGDVWSMLLFRIVALLHWFNPAAWRALARFEEASEWACDRRAAPSPREAALLARALVHCGEFRSGPRVAPAAARGALRGRVERLLRLRAPHSRKDAPMKILPLAAALLLVGIGGFLRPEIRPAPASEKAETPVATDAPAPDADAAPDADPAHDLDLVAVAVAADAPPAPRPQSQSQPDPVERFRRALAPSDDPDVKRFAEALATEPGRIVLADRAAAAAETVREEAAVERVPRFLEARLVHDDPRAKAFAEQLLADAETVSADLRAVAERFAETLRILVPDDTEEARLLARVLNHEGAAPALYRRVVQPRVRPDASLVADALGDVFLRDGENRHRLKSSGRERAQRLLAHGRAIAVVAARFAPEFRALAREIVDDPNPDRPNARLKRALAHPMAPVHAAAELFDDENPAAGVPAAEALVLGFLNRVDELTLDTADGLAVHPELLDDADELLDAFENNLRAVELVRAPLERFLQRLADDVPAEWAGFLASDPGRQLVARNADLGPDDPAGAVREFLDEYLVDPARENDMDDEGDDEDDEDGNDDEPTALRIRDDAREALAEELRAILADHREFRRANLVVDEAAARVRPDNPRLADALASPAGKIVLARLVREEIDAETVDGLARWIDDHFERDDDGALVPYDYALDALREFLADVENLERELQGDDDF